MDLYCAFCLRDDHTLARLATVPQMYRAITLCDGTAVCMNHLSAALARTGK